MSDNEPLPVKPFDFRQPCRLPMRVENRLLDWQRRACRLLPQKWTTQLSILSSCTAPSPETLDSTQAELPEYLVVFRLLLAGKNTFTLIGVPSQLAAAMVQAALGQVVEKLGDPREITSIEVSILELAIRDIVQSLNEAGVGAGYPECRLGAHEPRPLLIRLYPVESELVYLRFEVKLPFGEGSIYWVWPESLADDLFSATDDLSDPDPEFSQQLYEVAHRIPFDVRVQLGCVTLHVSELANLRVGDVLVLDQRISDPLKCHVENRPLLQAWPGVSGNRQAIQVDSILPA